MNFTVISSQINTDGLTESFWETFDINQPKLHVVRIYRRKVSYLFAFFKAGWKMFMPSEVLVFCDQLQKLWGLEKATLTILE